MTKSKQREPADAPRIRLVGPTAALATGLLSSSVGWAAPGDLDPTFGDVGRSVGWPGTTGTLWALQPLPDDDLLFSGCGGSYYTDCISTSFAGRLDGNGALDRLLPEALPGEAMVYDYALQPDGKVVAAGIARAGAAEYGVVFRLLPDGSLDKAFGTDGVVRFTGTSYAMASAESLALDQDGRIVVAGRRAEGTAVVRLLPGGAPDTSFGGPGGFLSTFHGPRLLSAAPGGGYRLLVYHAVEPGKQARCRVQAVTAGGQVDAGYGDGGLSQVEAIPTGWCNSAAVDAAGRLVVGGGSDDGRIRTAFLARVLGNGAVDPSFDARQVAASMPEVTDLAVAADGRVVITGQDRTGLSGVLVSRLLADGRLDPAFGRGGTSRVALRSSWPDNLWVNDLQLRANGDIYLGGGAWDEGFPPFAVRLLGGASPGGPGVLGFQVGEVQVREADGRAVLRIERLAGRSGPVSVDYATVADNGLSDRSVATPGADFMPVQGRLAWAEGDDSEREIVVPIIADAAGTESPERLQVVLSGVQGGGLALTHATVNIVGDAFPAGMFRIEARASFAENEGGVLVIVHREDYNQGEVSVLVGVTGGTAQAGSDFISPAPVRLTWRDGEWDSKTAAIVLVNDSTPESRETIEVSLSDATGGALIGPTKTVTVAIEDDDSAAGGGSGSGGGSGGGGGGGGSAGGLLALLTAAGAWLRRRRRQS